MRPSGRLPKLRLSIFGRTYLLMIAALAIAEGIGLVLLISRPPLHNAPVSLDQLAQRLAAPDGGVASLASRAGPPGAPPSGLPGLPPSGPPPGEPGFDADRGPPALVGGPDRPDGPPEAELRISKAPGPPDLPGDAALQTSEAVRRHLAERLQVDPAAVVAYIPENGMRAESPEAIGSATLREGFIVGVKRADGSWRVLQGKPESFPTMFQRQALLLFALGLLLLLPLAWLFARALSIPIANFSQAAKRLGADLGAAPLPVEGPLEMLAAIESFNVMQARLNALLQERTQMIAAIAHDLRTPLTRLAFRLDDLPSPLRDKVNLDIQEMKLMIAAALDFIRDRSLNSARERLDFRLLVESVVDDQTDQGRDVSLHLGAAITVLGDPLALRRAVMNLIDNAVKYGERARLQLAVSQEHCRLDIDDDGPGIAENAQSRVFEPFFRLESSRNRDTGGVGLGLALVRAILMDHGGDVRLHNRAPRGLRVTVTLPLAF